MNRLLNNLKSYFLIIRKDEYWKHFSEDMQADLIWCTENVQKLLWIERRLVKPLM